MKRTVWRRRKDGVKQRYHIGRKRKPTKHPTIKSKERKIFKHLSDEDNYQTEFGGGIDFDTTGKMERFEVRPGLSKSVELPTDFEVAYHTHPNKDIDLPSPEDLAGFLKTKKQQADMIFRDGGAFVIYRTKGVKNLERMSEPKLIKLFWQLYKKAAIRNSEKVFKKGLEELGFKVKLYDNKIKPIKLEIDPIQ